MPDERHNVGIRNTHYLSTLSWSQCGSVEIDCGTGQRCAYLRQFLSFGFRVFNYESRYFFDQQKTKRTRVTVI